MRFFACFLIESFIISFSELKIRNLTGTVYTRGMVYFIHFIAKLDTRADRELYRKEQKISYGKLHISIVALSVMSCFKCHISNITLMETYKVDA